MRKKLQIFVLSAGLVVGVSIFAGMQSYVASELCFITCNAEVLTAEEGGIPIESCRKGSGSVNGTYYISKCNDATTQNMIYPCSNQIRVFSMVELYSCYKK